MNRFAQDISTLAEWMDEARGKIDRWTQQSEGAGVDQRRQDFLQAVVRLISLFVSMRFHSECTQCSRFS